MFSLAVIGELPDQGPAPVHIGLPMSVIFNGDDVVVHIGVVTLSAVRSLIISYVLTLKLFACFAALNTQRLYAGACLVHRC